MNRAESEDINSYDDLLVEKARLELLIQNQKNIVRHDLDELKAEFRKEIRPAIEATAFIKKVLVPETRKGIVLNLGAQMALELISTAMFGKSSLLVRVLVPKILKNYTTHFISRFRSSPKLPGTRSNNY
jgi:hypothetical protein